MSLKLPLTPRWPHYHAVSQTQRQENIRNRLAWEYRQWNRSKRAKRIQLDTLWVLRNQLQISISYNRHVWSLWQTIGRCRFAMPQYRWSFKGAKSVFHDIVWHSSNAPCSNIVIPMQKQKENLGARLKQECSLEAAFELATPFCPRYTTFFGLPHHLDVQRARSWIWAWIRTRTAATLWTLLNNLQPADEQFEMSSMVAGMLEIRPLRWNFRVTHIQKETPNLPGRAWTKSIHSH